MDSAAIFRNALLEGKTVDEALYVLRNKGVTIGKSVIAVKNVLKLGFQDADNIVVNSETWRDLKDEVTLLRQAVNQVLEENFILGKTYSFIELERMEKDMEHKGQ